MNGSLSVAWRARALAACATLPPLVSIMSFVRLAALVGRHPARPNAAGPDDVVLSGYVARVLRRLPPPWRYTCLRRGIVLYYLLRKADRDARLHIGVRRDAEGAFVAHAWLTRRGVLLLEPAANQADQYRVIASFPEGDPATP